MSLKDELGERRGQLRMGPWLASLDKKVIEAFEADISEYIEHRKSVANPASYKWLLEYMAKQYGEYGFEFKTIEPLRSLIEERMSGI